MLTISNDFNWKPHIENMAFKAYNTLKFIKKEMYSQTQTLMFALRLNTASLYGTHGRINLDIRKIERVQRAAARHVFKYYGTTSSVTEMLNTLNWQTLESRRIKSSLILLYKTKYQLVAIDHFYLTETRNLNFNVPYSRTK